MVFDDLNPFYGRSGNYALSSQDKAQVNMVHHHVLLDILYIYCPATYTSSTTTINSLKNLRHRVQITSRLTDALKAIQTKRFDMILIDVDSDDNAKQITRMLRNYKHNNNPSVSIIAVSNIVTDTIRYEGKAFGMTDIILPPTNLKALQETLYQLGKKTNRRSFT